MIVAPGGLEMAISPIQKAVGSERKGGQSRESEGIMPPPESESESVKRWVIGPRGGRCGVGECSG